MFFGSDWYQMVAKSGLFRLLLSNSTVKISGKYTCPYLLVYLPFLFNNCPFCLYLFLRKTLYESLAITVGFVVSKCQLAVSQMFSSFIVMGAHEPGGSAGEGMSEDLSYLFYHSHPTNCYNNSQIQGWETDRSTGQRSSS